MKQPCLDITIEVEATRCRPHFTPNGACAQSWVGEWENNTADLSRQVAREFQRWIEGELLTTPAIGNVQN